MLRSRLSLCSLAAGAAALLAVPALAAPAETGPVGLYGTIGGGFNWLEDQDFNTGAAFGVVGTESDTGWDIHGALGYDFGVWRAEAEIGYSENEIDGASAGGVSLAGVSGETNASYFMINAYWDVPTTWWRFQPYLGGGIGMADVEVDGFNAGGVAVLNDNETVFAYQGIAGLAYHFTPEVAGMVEYRYFATEDVELTTTGGAGTDVNYDNHKLLAGLRFNF